MLILQIFFPEGCRELHDKTLGLSYLEGWRTRHAGNSTELPLFHLKTRIVCISHSPCGFVSLRTILVVDVRKPLSTGCSSGCRHREPALKVLGTMAVVWKKSCCPRMQWGALISHLKQWVFVCMIANDISSTFVAATGRDEWLKHVFIQWSKAKENTNYFSHHYLCIPHKLNYVGKQSPEVPLSPLEGCRPAAELDFNCIHCLEGQLQSHECSYRESCSAVALRASDGCTAMLLSEQYEQ